MMKQIFKEDISYNIFYSFLKLNGVKDESVIKEGPVIKEDYEINETENANKIVIKFNKECFKRCILQDTLQPFLRNIKPYYHISKQKYIDHAKKYNNFLTVLRQISKLLSIPYWSDLKYINSTYEIAYYFRIKD
jgi:hypothetical protein